MKPMTLRSWLLVAAWFVVIAVLLGAARATSQTPIIGGSGTGHGLGATHSHPPQDEAIHDKFYSTWMRPDQPELSCCNKMDCYPTEIKPVGGKWFAKRREDGEWIPVPAQKFEWNRDNPDGRSHVCMQAPGSVNMVYCAILGGGT